MRMGKKKRFGWWKRGLWLTVVSLLLPGSIRAAQTGKEPEELKNLYARGAVLMDGDSGRVLFGKNEREILPMASTTKIMTCILALEHCGLREICQVSAEAAAQPKVHLGMRAGETYYLEDLLYSLMLESHNDTAVCVAEHVGGSVEGFAELMNRKAEEIGCRDTHYVTPNGLDSEDENGAHGTTAADLALVMRYCISRSEKREEFLQITRAAAHQFQDTSGKRSFSCTNHNALLTMLDGALSGKTGFTGKAGYCYVGAARRGERTLIVALLACGWPNNRSYKWSDARRLLEYGFDRYEKKTLDLSGLQLPAVQICHGEEAQAQAGFAGAPPRLEMLLAPEEELRAEVRLPGEADAPVREGEQAGKAVCLLNGSPVAEYPLLYLRSVPRLSYLYCLRRTLEQFFLPAA